MSVVRATAQPSGVRATARSAAEAAWSRRHEPRAQWLAALTVAFVAACAAFGHVVEDYLTGDPIVRWDVDFARWLHEHSSPILVDIFKVVTLAGNAIVLALLTLVAVGLLARRRAFEQALLVVVVAVGIELLNAGLKLLFHRPRPELAFVHLDTYSFPSGHAAGSAAIYTPPGRAARQGHDDWAANPGRGRHGGVDRGDRLQSPLPRRALPLGRARRHRARPRVDCGLAARLRTRRLQEPTGSQATSTT